MQHSLFIIGSQMSLFFLCISFQNMMTRKILHIDDIFVSLRISSMADNLLWQLVNKLLVFPHSFLFVAHSCKLTCKPDNYPPTCIVINNRSASIRRLSHIWTMKFSSAYRAYAFPFFKYSYSANSDFAVAMQTREVQTSNFVHWSNAVLHPILF